MLLGGAARPDRPHPSHRSRPGSPSLARPAGPVLVVPGLPALSARRIRDGQETIPRGRTKKKASPRVGRPRRGIRRLRVPTRA